MINNDVLRSVRYMLDISDAGVADITRLAGLEIGRDDVIAFLQREEDSDYKPCSDRVLAHFLDGLIVYRRGRDESRPLLPVELPLTNNIVLKKLRVAFELRDDDILAILDEVGFPVSKAELGALFRKPGHSNYRLCGDQLLRNFLKGLTQRLRG
ncbi:hypothetical protein D3C76_525370 [compost metagenome]